MSEIAFGLRTSDNRIVTVNEVERGLSCGCICPGCKAALVAAKGNIVIHHFRHYAETPHCDGAPETALHILAKQIVAEADRIALPQITTTGNRVTVSSEAIRRTEIEPWMDGIRPDVLLHFDGETVAVEILVTHRVPTDKVRKLASRQQAAIEIDLSYYRNVSLSADDIRRAVLYDANRRWLYDPIAVREAEAAELVALRERERRVILAYRERQRQADEAREIWRQEAEAERAEQAAELARQTTARRAEREAMEQERQNRAAMAAQAYVSRQPPSLQRLVEAFTLWDANGNLVEGGYPRITPEAWAQFDRDMSEWKEHIRFGEFHKKSAT